MPGKQFHQILFHSVNHVRKFATDLIKKQPWRKFIDFKFLKKFDPYIQS